MNRQCPFLAFYIFNIRKFMKQKSSNERTKVKDKNQVSPLGIYFKNILSSTYATHEIKLFFRENKSKLFSFSQLRFLLSALRCTFEHRKRKIRFAKNNFQNFIQFLFRVRGVNIDFKKVKNQLKWSIAVPSCAMWIFLCVWRPFTFYGSAKVAT